MVEKTFVLSNYHFWARFWTILNFGLFWVILGHFSLSTGQKSSLAGWGANFHENYIVFKMKCLIIYHNKGIWGKQEHFYLYPSLLVDPQFTQFTAVIFLRSAHFKYRIHKVYSGLVWYVKCIGQDWIIIWHANLYFSRYNNYLACKFIFVNV